MNKEIKRSDFLFHDTIPNWGKVMQIMKKDESAFVRFYIYNEDTTSGYIDSLSVSKYARKRGIGNYLLTLIENTARVGCVHFVFLSVEKGSWMYEWYSRCGYVYYLENVTEPNQIWMQKEIKP